MKELITGILLGATLLTPTICLAEENQNLREMDIGYSNNGFIQKKVATAYYPPYRCSYLFYFIPYSLLNLLR